MRYIHNEGVLKQTKKISISMIAIALIAASSIAAFGVTNAAKPTKCTTIQSGELQDSSGNVITTGYDDWGYNYQAKIFNGYYDNYLRPADPVEDGDWLQMKWNDGWLANQSCDDNDLLDRHYGHDSYIGSGAWLTNHMSGTYTTWSILGDWQFDYTFGGRVYSHDVFITDFDETSGDFSGTAAYPAGGPYTITETIEGKVTDKKFTMTAMYDDSNYEVYVDGVINEDGSLLGSQTTSANQSGTFVTSTGEAIATEQNWTYFVKIVAVPVDANKHGGTWFAADGTEIGPVIWGDFAIIQELSNDTGTGEHGVSYKSLVNPGLGFWQNQ